MLSELLPSPLAGLLAFREELVPRVARIKVVPDDRPRRSGARGDGALADACARAPEHRTW